MSTEDLLRQSLERLGKWRGHFAGWQLGSRAHDDPEFQAIRNHRELSMLLRVEVTAITGLLISKGLVTQEEIQEAMLLESEELQRAYERQWPGAKSTDDGMAYDLRLAMQWMSGWLP